MRVGVHPHVRLEIEGVKQTMLVALQDEKAAIEEAVAKALHHFAETTDYEAIAKEMVKPWVEGVMKDVVRHGINALEWDADLRDDMKKLVRKALLKAVTIGEKP